MLEMNPEIRARWTAALRSGTYRQGQAALRSVNDRFCCLGVLCDLAEMAGVVRAYKNPDNWQYDGADAYLPEAVMDWAGITDASPHVNVRSSMEDRPTLVTLNDDDEWDFAQIADAIDGEPS
jgi:hypothetical protein